MVLDYLRTANPGHLQLSAVQQIVENAAIETLSFSRNLKMLNLYQEFGYSDAYLVPIRVPKNRKENREGQQERQRTKGNQRENNRENLLFTVLCKGATKEEFS